MVETAWGPMLRTAMAIGVAPEAFWRLSLKEWRMLTTVPAGVVPMARAELEDMMRTWPDDG